MTKIISKLIKFLIMLLMPTVAFSAFFALDDVTYRKSVCESTAQDITQFETEKYWLDNDSKVGNLPKAQRQEWAERYIVTVALAEEWKKEYEDNCE
jgi:hypothetical protein